MSFHDIVDADGTVYTSEVDDRIAELVKEDDRIAELVKEIAAAGSLGTAKEHAELTALRRFKADAEGAAGKGWDQLTIVSEAGFTDYAYSYAESISNIDHIASYVDWDRFAHDLKSDFCVVEYDGDTFYVR